MNLETIIKNQFIDIPEENVEEIRQCINQLIHNVVFYTDEVGGVAQLKYDLVKSFRSRSGDILQSVIDAINKINAQSTYKDGELSEYIIALNYYEDGEYETTCVLKSNDLFDSLLRAKRNIETCGENNVEVTIYDTTCDRIYNDSEIKKLLNLL